MVPRRFIRGLKSSLQLALIGIFLFSLIVFLDNQFRVLPQSIHDHLPTHHEGLVVIDVSITTCSTLNPFSKCSLDQPGWFRLDKDLYLGRRWEHAYLHVQRKREEELDAGDSVIVDVIVSKVHPAINDETRSEQLWELRQKGVWILRSGKRHESDNKKVITAVDVLFGADATDPRPGWSMMNTPLLLNGGSATTEAHLSLRRGQRQEPKRPVPRIRRDGRFKILQLADLHLATGFGLCREPEPPNLNGGHCDADPRTLDFVRRIVDEEVPDLVILSGDQVNGDTAPDPQSAIFKMADIFIKRANPIPYAAIFGNHDDEGTMARAAQMALMETLPYSLSEAGPEEIDGVGNYVVEILAPGSSSHSALTLYFLDTHAYSPDEKKFHGYDWIKDSQIKWFKDTSKSLRASHNKYTKIHMDMAFIHIPLPEYRDKENKIVGEWREAVTAPTFNSGFKDALVEQGVLTVSCGHDHVNSYCALSESAKTKEPELWMCYGGGVGFGGYGGYNGYHRRLRVYEIDTNEARISTWKRLEYGDISARIDEQILVDGGKVVDLTAS